MDLKILDLPLRVLRLPGLHPEQTSWISKLTSFTSIVTAVIVLVTSVMEMCRREWTIVSIVPEVETFMAAMEVV